MAKAGMGEPFIVSEESEAATVANKFREYIQTPVLPTFKFDLTGSILTTSTRFIFRIYWRNDR
jgi:hypothetical protein